MTRTLGVVVLLLSSSAFAQQPESDAQIAQALFDEGHALMSAQAFDRACPLLERSQKLDPGGGTLLNLGICWEGQGKLARATTALEDALRLARHDARHDREDIALAHLASLRPRLPHLRLVLREPLPEVDVELDDAKVGAQLLGALLPVDPGSHHVRVWIEGRLPFEWRGALAEGEQRELDVVLPFPPPPPERRVATMSWVLAGVSVASLVATGVTGGIAFTAKSSFDSNCLPDRGFCMNPAQGQSDYDLMRATAWASTVTLGVAVVAAVVALVWPRTVVPVKTGANLVVRF